MVPLGRAVRYNLCCASLHSGFPLPSLTQKTKNPVSLETGFSKTRGDNRTGEAYLEEQAQWASGIKNEPCLKDKAH